MGGQDAFPSTQEAIEDEPAATDAVEETLVFQVISPEAPAAEELTETAADVIENDIFAREQPAQVELTTAPICESVDAKALSLDADAATFEFPSADCAANEAPVGPQTSTVNLQAAEVQSSELAEAIAAPTTIQAEAQADIQPQPAVFIAEATCVAAAPVPVDPVEPQSPPSIQPVAAPVLTELTQIQELSQESCTVAGSSCAAAAVVEALPAPEAESVIVAPTTLLPLPLPAAAMPVATYAALEPSTRPLWSLVKSRSIRRHMLRIAVGFAIGWVVKMCFFGA